MGPATIFNIIGWAVAILALAIFVSYLTRKIVGFRPRFLGVYMALLISYAGMFIFGFFMREAGVLGRQATNLFESLIILTIGVFFQAGFMALFFKGDDGQTVTYFQALMIGVTQTAIGVMISVAIAIVAAA